MITKQIIIIGIIITSVIPAFCGPSYEHYLMERPRLLVVAEDEDSYSADTLMAVESAFQYYTIIDGGASSGQEMLSSLRDIGADAIIIYTVIPHRRGGDDVSFLAISPKGYNLGRCLLTRRDPYAVHRFEKDIGKIIYVQQTRQNPNDVSIKEYYDGTTDEYKPDRIVEHKPVTKRDKIDPPTPPGITAWQSFVNWFRGKKEHIENDYEKTIEEYYEKNKERRSSDGK